MYRIVLALVVLLGGAAMAEAQYSLPTFSTRPTYGQRNRAQRALMNEQYRAKQAAMAQAAWWAGLDSQERLMYQMMYQQQRIHEDTMRQQWLMLQYR